MAILKKINFGDGAHDIAKTVLTSKEGGVMSVAAPNGVTNGEDEQANYQYELDVNVDDSTIKKLGGKLTVGTVPAEKVSVDNTAAGITSTNAQAAFKELKNDIADVISNGKTYSIIDATSTAQDLPTNVLKRYRLQETVGSTNNLVGEPIDILKDNSLLAAKLSTMDATWSGSAIVDGTGAEALVLVYKDANGEAQVIHIDVSAFLKEAEFNDGLQVNGGVVSVKLGQGLKFGDEVKNKSINVKIDSTSETFLTVGDEGVKLSGVQGAINNAVAGLNVTDAAVNGQVVTAVSEINGKVSSTKADFAGIKLGGFTQDANATGAIADTDTLGAALNKLENGIDAAKQAAEAGHSAVAKDANARHLTLSEATDGKTGKKTYTIGEDNIASGSDLTTEVTRAKHAEDEIASKVGLTGEEGSRTFASTQNYGNGSTSVVDNMQKIDTALKAVSDKADAIQYKVNGTTLEFFGISEKQTV